MPLSVGSRAAAEQDRSISPRRSTTQHRYTPGGTWNRARIVRAARQWFEETGAPPRSWEWCPASGRSAGLIGADEHKWEREHPRWPGNTTAYRFFRSWADLLEEAGLPPYQRGHENPLEERIAAAQRLHAAGIANKQIARELGFHENTVSRYLRAHPCRHCAAPVVGDGTICHACATRRANPRRWTRAEVVEAVCEWEAVEGRPPLQADWRPAAPGAPPNRWEREFPRWPPASAIVQAFGSWGAMRVARGEEIYHRPWDPDEVVQALREFAERHGRAPRKTELENPPTGMPSAPTVRRRFGSYAAGLRAAGLEPKQQRWSDEEILSALRRFKEAHGRWPTTSDWKHNAPGHPTASLVIRRLGSWRAVLDRARRTGV